MSSILALTKRNIKIYFKDKGMFITSLITPVILLVLYVTFLKNVYEQSFQSAFMAAGITIPEKLLNGCVGGELVSSLLAVCCVTVAFSSNLLMIQDKSNGSIRDLTMTPMKPSVLALSYGLATFISTILICFTATAICLAYLAYVGWYLSVADVLLLGLDVILLVLFGTSLALVVNFPLSTDGQASAVGTIVSAGYGFICGAYMPIANFSLGVQRVIMFLPGTYGTSLLRNHMLNGVFADMTSQHFPAEMIVALRDSVDCNIYFFGHQVTIPVMYMVLIGTIFIALTIYILMNVFVKRKKR